MGGPDTGCAVPSPRAMGNLFRGFFIPTLQTKWCTVPLLALGLTLGTLPHGPSGLFPHQDTEEVDLSPLAAPLNAALVSASLEYFGRMPVENS